MLTLQKTSIKLLLACLSLGPIFGQGAMFFGQNIASVPFSPSDLSGLQVWHLADFGSNCSGACTNGASQTTWADKSSNANNATNGTLGAFSCSSGTYNTSQINGKPAVQFVNSPTCFVWGTPINLQTASTMFLVARLTTATGNQSLVTGATGNPLMYEFGRSGKEQSLITSGTVLVAGSAASNTSWHQVNATYNGTTATLRIDRAPDGSASPGEAITTNELGFGFNARNPSDIFSGQLAEMIIYNRVLTSPEITQVENYLNGRYGL